jgi:hypothetical protein
MMKRAGIALRSFRRESQKGIGYAADWFARRFYLRFIHRQFPLLPSATIADRERKITVVIPAAEKDTPVLSHCLQAVREMIHHEVAAVWIIGPESPRIREITVSAGYDFIHEDSILPRPAVELKCRGWVLQQMIKFNVAFHVPTDDYLVLDADTVFLRPQTFFRNDKTVLRFSDQYELLYNRSLELFFGHNRRFPVSFVTHHGIFNKVIVKELLGLFEHRFKRPWWEAILYEVDQGHLISFSEYEFYGNFVVSQPHWKRHFVLEHWRGLNKRTEDVQMLPQICLSVAGKLNSISFHAHTQ